MNGDEKKIRQRMSEPWQWEESRHDRIFEARDIFCDVCGTLIADGDAVWENLCVGLGYLCRECAEMECR